MFHFFTRDWKKNNRKQFPSVKVGNDVLIYINIKRVLRRFHTRRNVSGLSRRHRFFSFCTCVKVLFTDTFLKC